MKSTRMFLLTVFMLVLAGSIYAAPQPIKTISYMSFNPQTQQFDLPQLIIYQFPDPMKFGTGPFPVFFWTAGTFEQYDDPLAITFITQMSSRGFIGASAQYSNARPAQQTCMAYTKRAQGVFDSARSTSAVSAVCAVSGADCSGKGIVTSGVSQGAALAVLAKNYAPSVKATYAMSISDYNQAAYGVNLASCMDKNTTAIPANRLTIVNGQNDTFFAGQTPLQNVSGYTCPTGSTQCWSPDGSGAGWYIVQNSQTTDGNADHCYMLLDGCGYSSVEPNWYTPNTFNWDMAPNMDWLASFGTKRTFSTSGQ